MGAPCVSGGGGSVRGGAGGPAWGGGARRAESPLQRMRGLLGRKSLAPEEGILLRPAGSVHTAFMRFPIDVVFVDAEGTVLKVADSVPPWRTSAAKGAKAVVELAAGAAAASGLAAGQR